MTTKNISCTLQTGASPEQLKQLFALLNRTGYHGTHVNMSKHSSSTQQMASLTTEATKVMLFAYLTGWQ
jgi:hypothetical protein